MVKVNKKIIGWLVSALLITLFMWYFLTHLDDFKILLQINIWFVVLLFVLNLASIASNGLFMKYSVSLFGKTISYGEGVRVSLISTVGNFFAPAGSGLAIRAVYLKKRHDLTYSNYVSIIFCNYIIVFFINSILGLLSLYMLRDRIAKGSFVLVLFFSSILAVSFLALFIRANGEKKLDDMRPKWLKYIYNTARQISVGWSLILRDKKRTAGLISIVLLNSVLLILGTYAIMLSLNIKIDFASALLFSVLGSMSLFINITPGNLGIKEAVYIVFSSLIGLTAAQILSASLLDRVITFIIIFILWLIFGRNLHSSINKIVKN